MSLLENMTKKRREATSVSEQELNMVLEKISEAFEEWQERDIDRRCFKMYVEWKDNVLLMETVEEGDPKTYSVTDLIQSKKKQSVMFDQLEKKLAYEGVNVSRKDMDRRKETVEISFTVNIME